MKKTRLELIYLLGRIRASAKNQAQLSVCDIWIGRVINKSNILYQSDRQEINEISMTLNHKIGYFGDIKGG